MPFVRWENIKLLWKSQFLYCCWNFCAPNKYRFWGHLNLYLLLFSLDCTQVSVKFAKSLGVIFLCSANTSYGITSTTSSCRASLRCLQVTTITWKAWCKYQNGWTGLNLLPYLETPHYVLIITTNGSENLTDKIIPVLPPKTQPFNPKHLGPKSMLML